MCKQIRLRTLTALRALAAVFVLAACSDTSEDTAPEASYSFIYGEYQTALGTLVVNKSENYLLSAESGEKLTTTIDYHYDGSFDVTIPSTTTAISSRTANVTPYRSDNSNTKFSSGTLTCKDTVTTTKIAVNKKTDSIKIYKQTNHFMDSPHFESTGSMGTIEVYNATFKAGTSTYNLNYSSVTDSTHFYFSASGYTWKIDSPFTYPQSEITYIE